MYDIESLSVICAAIAVSFGALGPALAEGKAVAAAMEAIARQPEAAGVLSRTLFVGPRDDRDDGDLLSRHRAASALRQSLHHQVRRQARMQIDWWTLGLQTVNALVLIWLLSRFLFRPIAVDPRRAARGGGASPGGRRRKRGLRPEALEAKAQAALDALAADRAASVRAATAEAEEARRVLLEAAHAEAERLRANTQAEIERLKKSEARAQSERANLLSLDIARRLLERLPPAAQVAGFLDGLVEAIGALSARDARGVSPARGCCPFRPAPARPPRRRRCCATRWRKPSEVP